MLTPQRVEQGRFYIRREIGIDAGHRVTNHASKCRNFHGHRYTVQALYSGELGDAAAGSSEGMAGGLDFGFVKEHMLREIDARCDHAMILWALDPMLRTFIGDRGMEVLAAMGTDRDDGVIVTGDMGKVYVVDDVPTAENLARHWYRRLDRALSTLPDAYPYHPRLEAVSVYETPNNMVIYYG